MTETDHEHELLLQVVNAVYGAHDLESALRGTVRAVQNELSLWHASVWVHDAEREVVRVVGSWSLTESAFDPGLEVSTSITPPLARLVVDMHAGRVFTATLDTHGRSLLDHLMREEGVAGLVTIPLAREEHGLLFLALGCASAEELHTVPKSLFAGLSASAGARYVKLAHSTSS